MHLLDDKVCFYCGEKRLCVRFFQDDSDSLAYDTQHRPNYPGEKKE